MTNNKKSSVDYLLDHLHYKDSLKWAEVIEKAKAMHKEEIINAYWAGIDDHLNQNKMPNSEGYYNETYGGNK